MITPDDIAVAASRAMTTMLKSSGLSDEAQAKALMMALCVLASEQVNPHAAMRETCRWLKDAIQSLDERNLLHAGKKKGEVH